MKAASTPSEPGASAAAAVVVFFGAAFAGASAGVCDLFVFVVVRGRGVAVEEFEFCAATTPHVRTINANILIIIDTAIDTSPATIPKANENKIEFDLSITEFIS